MVHRNISNALVYTQTNLARFGWIDLAGKEVISGEAARGVHWLEVSDRRGLRQILFDAPRAMLPLVKKDDGIGWVQWGVLQSLELNFLLALPHSSWIRHGYITAGRVRRWHPRPVLIIAEKFLIMADGEALWIPLGTELAIQGALISSDREEALRVYVVIEPPPQAYANVREHWPRIIRFH